MVQPNRAFMKEGKKEKEIVKRFASRGVFPYQMAFTLLIPLRNIFLSPKQLISRLDLKDDHNVMELGPGPGYFSIRIASLLTRGQLVLADIQKEMLDMARRRVNRMKLGNVSYYLCDGSSFRFPDNYFDRIFMVTVIGEVENKEAYLREFRRIIRPDGIVSVSELAGDPDKLTLDEVKELFRRAGFKPAGMYGNKRNYTINFVRE